MPQAITLLTGLIGLLSALLGLAAAYERTRAAKPSSGIDIESTELREVLKRSNIAAAEKAKISEAIDLISSKGLLVAKNLRNFLVFSLTISILVAALTSILYYQSSPSWLLSSLENQDSAVFRRGKDGALEIARVFGSVPELQELGSFKEIINGTQSELSIVAFTAHQLFSIYEADILELLKKRNVRVRFILTDHSNANESLHRLTSEAMGYVGEQATRVQLDSKNVRDRINGIKFLVERDKRAFPGTLEIRWYTGPVFYSLVLRDPGAISGVGQVGVYMYKDFSNRPYYRFSSLAKGHMEKLHAQFETLWLQAK